MSEKPEKLVDYTIYDDKFRAYRVKVPEHKVSLYNMGKFIYNLSISAPNVQVQKFAVMFKWKLSFQIN